MTQDIQDQLDRLTNPQTAKEFEQERQRSSFRPPFTKVTCDIVNLEGPYKAMLNNGQEVTRIGLQLQNIHSIEATTPFAESTYKLELGLPTNPNPHSEVTLMVASAQAVAPNVDSVRKLAGLKGVRLEERVHEYEGNKFVEGVNGKTTNREGKRGDWIEAAMQTRYYHVVTIGAGAAANGSQPAVTEDRLEEAKHIVDGLTHAEAQEALGEDSAAVLSKLILTKRVKQESGKYQLVS